MGSFDSTSGNSERGHGRACGQQVLRKRRGRGQGGTDVLDGRAEQFGLGVAGVSLQI